MELGRNSRSIRLTPPSNVPASRTSAVGIFISPGVPITVWPKAHTSTIKNTAERNTLMYCDTLFILSEGELPAAKIQKRSETKNFFKKKTAIHKKKVRLRA
jgi:hypothetical protein